MVLRLCLISDPKSHTSRSEGPYPQPASIDNKELLYNHWLSWENRAGPRERGVGEKPRWGSRKMIWESGPRGHSPHWVTRDEMLIEQVDSGKLEGRMYASHREIQKCPVIELVKA